MDPISLAITTAIATGVAEGIASTVTSAAPSAVATAYHSLKDLLKRRFGSQGRIVQAVIDLESNPDSPGRKLTLQEEVKLAQADKDTEILAAAQVLHDQLQSSPKAQKIVQQIAHGTNIAQAGDGGTASINVQNTTKYRR